jgi:hypothetical protein
MRFGEKLLEYRDGPFDPRAEPERLIVLSDASKELHCGRMEAIRQEVGAAGTGRHGLEHNLVRL